MNKFRKLGVAYNFLSLEGGLFSRTEQDILYRENYYSNDSNNNRNSNGNKTSSCIQPHNTQTTTISIRPRRLDDEPRIEPFSKRILIVDDDPDITLTFKKGLEVQNNEYNKTLFEVYSYNNPLEALHNFKPNFYDLLLIDINMPGLNGFEFATKILELDANPRVCFMSSGIINQEALREQYRTLSIGCFIRKPVTIDYLIKRVKAELE